MKTRKHVVVLGAASLGFAISMAWTFYIGSHVYEGLQPPVDYVPAFEGWQSLFAVTVPASTVVSEPFFLQPIVNGVIYGALAWLLVLAVPRFRKLGSVSPR